MYFVFFICYFYELILVIWSFHPVALLFDLWINSFLSANNNFLLKLYLYPAWLHLFEFLVLLLLFSIHLFSSLDFLLPAFPHRYLFPCCCFQFAYLYVVTTFFNMRVRAFFITFFNFIFLFNVSVPTIQSIFALTYIKVPANIFTNHLHLN